MNLLFPNYSIVNEVLSEKHRKFGALVVLTKDGTDRYVCKYLEKKPGNLHEIERLKNETNYSFDGSYLPKIYEIIENDTYFGYIRSYHHGKDLFSYIRSFPKKMRFAVLQEVLESLIPIFKTLETKSICHGDIKPSNILVSGKPGSITVSLIDFGLSLSFDNPPTRKLIFPLGFAAPELILNRLDLVDSSTDLFALGITIYKCLDGDIPLKHENPSVYTNLQLTYPIPVNGRLGTGMNALVQKLCVKPTFKTSPNRLSSEEVKDAILKMKKNRLQSLSEGIQLLHATKEHKSFFKRLVNVFSKS